MVEARSDRSIAASAITQFVLAMGAVEIAGFVELAFPAPTPPDDPATVLLMMPFLLCGAPFFLVASLLVVLPTVAAARWAGTRFTGREVWWWVPVVALVPAALGAAAVGAALRLAPGTLLLCWAAGAALLTVTALVVREVVLRRRRLRGVIGWVRGRRRGRVRDRYGPVRHRPDRGVPPAEGRHRPTGRDLDGRQGGGTLRLAADGTAQADALTDPEEAWSDPAKSEPAKSDPAKSDPAKRRCSGQGTWSYKAGDSTTWGQRVELRIEGCFEYGPPGGWRIGGTPDRLELNYEYGDSDSPDWYTLFAR